jgi:hypothetical protein
MPAPLIEAENATWNCPAMKAPDDRPDTDVCPGLPLSVGKGAAAWAGLHKAAHKDAAQSREWTGEKAIETSVESL